MLGVKSNEWDNFFFQLLERIMNTIQSNRAKSMKSIEQLRNTIDEQMRQSIHSHKLPKRESTLETAFRSGLLEGRFASSSPTALFFCAHNQRQSILQLKA